MRVVFDPIVNWPLLAVVALAVTVLTVWAYKQLLRGTSGLWRWVALGLRLAAVLLCLIAALRPQVIFQEKKKQPAVLVFLLDDSMSMKLTDEVNGQSRWALAQKTLKEAREAARGLGSD